MTKFIEITNHDIFKKLEKIDLTVNEIKLHAIETNGKVKLNTAQIKICYGLVLGLITTITGLKLGGIF